MAVSSLGVSNIHVLEPGVKINGTYYRDIVLRGMLLPDIREASFSYFCKTVPHHIVSKTVALLEQKTPVLSHPRSGRLTRPTSTRSTIACGVCFTSEYTVPRSRMLTS